MKYNRNNAVLMLVIMVIVGFSLSAIFNNMREFNMNIKAYNYKINKCNTISNNDTTIINYCNEIKKWGGPKRSDTFFTFFDILFDDRFTIMQILLPFLIIMCSISKINEKLKSGFIKNELLRQKYKSFVIKEWIDSLKKLFIIPFMFLIIAVAAYILTGNFDYKNSLLNFNPWVNPIFFDNIVISIIIYLTNFLLHGIFIINIGYIATKKSRGYIFSVLTAYISYLGLWAISETFFGYFIMSGLLKKPELHNYFSFTTLWGYPNINNFVLFTLYQAIITIISCICFYLSYRNKEGVLIANEQ